MANWPQLLVRLVSRIVISRGARSLFRQFTGKQKPKRNRQNRKNRPNQQNKETREYTEEDFVGPYEEAPSINYYKIIVQVQIVLAAVYIFYLAIEKKLPFLN